MHRSSGLPRRARATTTSNRLQQNHSQKPERLHRVHKFFTAMPRNNIYFHWRETPAPPENGWQPARLNETNPAYLYLKDLILRGQIEPTTEAHILYNTHPDLGRTSVGFHAGRMTIFNVRDSRAVLEYRMSSNDQEIDSPAEEEKKEIGEESDLE